MIKPILVYIYIYQNYGLEDWNPHKAPEKPTALKGRERKRSLDGRAAFARIHSHCPRHSRVAEEVCSRFPHVSGDVHHHSSSFLVVFSCSSLKVAILKKWMSIPWNINEHHRLLHSESCFGFTAGPRWVTTSGHSTPWHEHVHRRPDTGSLWTKCFHRFLYDWHALIFCHILILACPATSWSHVFSCNFLSFRRTSRSQRNYFCWSSKTEVSRYFFKLSHFRGVTSFQVQHCFCIEFQDSPKIGYDMIGSMEDFDRLWWMTWNSHGTEPTCHFSATVELPNSFSELDLNG